MIALLGYGKTNQAMLQYCNAQGIACIICDDAFSQERKDDFGNIFTQDVSHFPSTIQIPSPGIPPYHKMIKDSSNLVSEYDYILSRVREKQIWISGTNGKTTTTEMLEWILKDFGGVCGGNIGKPLAQMIEMKPKIWILETSSFSLHYTKQVFPNVYLLLPVKEDHIVWHGSFEGYLKDKLGPLKRMDSSCIAFIPQELQTRQEIQNTKAQVVFYQSSQDLAKWLGISTQDFDFKEPFLLDALLALCGAKALLQENLSQKLKGYTIGAHKIEEFLDFEGRKWVDDSKGTNVDATIWALKNYKKEKIYLILGGDDKGVDLSALFEFMQECCVEIFGIGSNTQRLQEFAKEYKIHYHPCFYLEEAVKMIHKIHTKKSIALLSPAASSLDQFSSYKERGEKFQKLVKSLEKKR